MIYGHRLDDYWKQIALDGNLLPDDSTIASAIDDTADLLYLYGCVNPASGAKQTLCTFDLATQRVSGIHDLAVPPLGNPRLFRANDGTLYLTGSLAPRPDGTPPNRTIFMIEPTSGRMSSFDTGIEDRFQPGTAFDPDRGVLYLTGGFGKIDHWAIDPGAETVRELPVFSEHARAGMLYRFLPDGTLFLFSGFSHIDGTAVCHHDFFIFDPGTEKIAHAKLREPFGRTFSKCIVNERLDKLLIFGGSSNGMETSGAFYFYDYRSGLFNGAQIDQLPGGRVEPAMEYSARRDTAYIIGGLQPRGHEYLTIPDIMCLDMGALPATTWSGHPR